MADNLPDPAPAPAPVTPQAPAPEPVAPAAEPTPAPQISLDSFSDDEKKYLQSQGVTDISSPDAIKKIINHAQSSQRTAAQIKSDYDKIKNITNPQPASNNPFALPGVQPSTTPDGQPAQPGQPQQQPQATEQPAQPQAGGLDPLAAYNLANNLAQNFPELKEQLTDGRFYNDMQGLGIPLKLPDGNVNIQGILQYGKIAQERAQLEAKIADANKPGGEDVIPDANPTTPTQPADDAPMTKQMALAIGQHVAAGNTHPRADEATKFLQYGPPAAPAQPAAPAK